MTDCQKIMPAKNDVAPKGKSKTGWDWIETSGWGNAKSTSGAYNKNALPFPLMCSASSSQGVVNFDRQTAYISTMLIFQIQVFIYDDMLRYQGKVAHSHY